MAKTNQSSLEDAYVGAHGDASLLLEELQTLISDMPAPENDAYPINWGHVGSLNYLCQQLRDLKQHAAGLATK